MGEFDATFGTLYIGTTIGLVLFGITVLQTHFYYLYYGHDSPKLKLLVAFVFLQDAVHSAFICHVNYYYLVSSVGHPERLQNGVWSLFCGAGITVLLSVTVKSLYITQVYRLCRPRWRWWVCGPLIIFMLGHFASGLETIANVFIRENFGSVTNSQTDSITLSVTNLVSDTTVAVALCVLLRNRRSEVRNSQINSVINNIIIFCVERFLLSMIVSVALLVTEIATPHGFYDAALDMIYGKVVANSLLATLNSRLALKGSKARGDPSTTGDTTSTIPMTTRPVQTVITGIFTTGNTVESSIDDAEGYGLRTRDLEASIRSDKS